MLDMEAATSPRAIAVPTAGGGPRFRAELFRWAGAADYPHGGICLNERKWKCPDRGPPSLRPWRHVLPALSEGVSGLTTAVATHQNVG